VSRLKIKTATSVMYTFQSYYCQNIFNP